MTKGDDGTIRGIQARDRSIQKSRPNVVVMIGGVNIEGATADVPRPTVARRHVDDLADEIGVRFLRVVHVRTDMQTLES